MIETFLELQVYISQFWLSRNSFFWPRNKKKQKKLIATFFLQLQAFLSQFWLFYSELQVYVYISPQNSEFISRNSVFFTSWNKNKRLFQNSDPFLAVTSVYLTTYLAITSYLANYFLRSVNLHLLYLHLYTEKTFWIVRYKQNLREKKSELSDIASEFI